MANFSSLSNSLNYNNSILHSEEDENVQLLQTAPSRPRSVTAPLLHTFCLLFFERDLLFIYTADPSNSILSHTRTLLTLKKDFQLVRKSNILTKAKCPHKCSVTSTFVHTMIENTCARTHTHTQHASLLRLQLHFQGENILQALLHIVSNLELSTY